MERTMAHFKVNQKDIFFILKDQLNYGSLCDLERYKDLNEKTLDMLVNEAMFAKGVVDPLQELGEEQGVRFENGEVCVLLNLKKHSNSAVKTDGSLRLGMQSMAVRGFRT